MLAIQDVSICWFMFSKLDLQDFSGSLNESYFIWNRLMYLHSQSPVSAERYDWQLEMQTQQVFDLTPRQHSLENRSKHNL